MNNTSFNCSLNDTTELRNLILENPDLPLLVFCGEESWHDEWSYESAEVNSVSIQNLTLYDDIWMDEYDYKEKLSDDLCNEEEYKDLSDEEYDRMLDKKVKETKFVKAIVIYVG